MYPAVPDAVKSRHLRGESLALGHCHVLPRSRSIRAGQRVLLSRRQRIAPPGGDAVDDANQVETCSGSTVPMTTD